MPLETDEDWEEHYEGKWIPGEAVSETNEEQEARHDEERRNLRQMSQELQDSDEEDVPELDEHLPSGWGQEEIAVVSDAALVDSISRRLAETHKDRVGVLRNPLTDVRALRAIRVDESAEFLEMLFYLIQAAEHISPDETSVTDMTYVRGQDEVILLRYKGKAFALSAEGF